MLYTLLNENSMQKELTQSTSRYGINNSESFFSTMPLLLSSSSHPNDTPLTSQWDSSSCVIKLHRRHVDKLNATVQPRLLPLEDIPRA